MKEIIHKRQNNRYVCGGANPTKLKMRVTWNGVTCKNCLRSK